MKSHQLTSGLILLSTHLSQVTAWGAMGHETVAYVAQNFVTDDTKTYFQDILGDTSSSYLASVAPWADTFRYTSFVSRIPLSSLANRKLEQELSLHHSISLMPKMIHLLLVGWNFRGIVAILVLLLLLIIM